MASAKLMIPKRSAPYYVLTANVTVHGKRVRRYGRFDFDPTVLKTHRQRENAAIEAALVFERAEQQKADDEKNEAHHEGKRKKSPHDAHPEGVGQRPPLCRQTLNFLH